jgi:demethylmenaquinone methyltransferase / 2-methoxy-6-polyprenyl-1,4-benzoquinol methylase
MSSGAAPPGVTGEEQTSRWVRSMFGQVAPRYDLLNHLLSFQSDRYWRWRTVRRLRPILQRPDARVLDICCGSGDLTLALRGGGTAQVFGSDFCHPMLIEARAKDDGRLGPRLFESDALQLPVADASLDLITAAFGFRNLANYQAGLTEMLRVLKPGGTAAILEFSTPPNPVFRGFYNFYSTRVLPVLGGIISGSRDAYTYLPDSVRKFPPAPRLAQDMEAVGFQNVEFRYMTGGIVALHTGRAGR